MIYSIFLVKIPIFFQSLSSGDSNDKRGFDSRGTKTEEQKKVSQLRKNPSKFKYFPPKFWRGNFRFQLSPLKVGKKFAWWPTREPMDIIKFHKNEIGLTIPTNRKFFIKIRIACSLIALEFHWKSIVTREQSINYHSFLSLRIKRWSI